MSTPKPPKPRAQWSWGYILGWCWKDTDEAVRFLRKHRAGKLIPEHLR